MKSVKMSFQNEIKKGSVGTYDELLTTISNSYGLPIDGVKKMNVSYLDDDGDNVQIANEYDFKQAVIFMEKQNVDVLKVAIDGGFESRSIFESQNFVLVNPEELTFQSPILSKSIRKISVDDDHILSLRESEGFEEIKKNFDGELVRETSEKFVNETNQEEYTNFVKAVVDEFERKVDACVNTIKEEEKVQEECSKKEKKKRVLKKKLQAKIESILENAPKVEGGNIIEAKSDDLIESLKAETASLIKEKISSKLNKLKVRLIKKVTRRVHKYIDYKASQRKPIIRQPNSNEVHPNISCHGCGVLPIIGNRFKCTVCENFDYCEACEEKNQQTHTHPFIKIRNPSQAPKQIITIINDDDEADYGVEQEGFKKINNQVNYYINRVVDNIKDLDLIPNKVFDFFRPDGDKKLDQKPSATCNTKIIEVVNNKTVVKKNIRLTNNGTVNWPKPAHFTCLTDESAVCGPSVPIRVAVVPGTDANVEVTFDLKDIKAPGTYISKWVLQNEQHVAFSDKFDIEVVVDFKDEIVIRNEFVEAQPKAIPSWKLNILKKEIAKKLKENLPNVTDREIDLAFIHVGPDYETCYKILSSKYNSCKPHNAALFK
jgi:hypothetical protein